MDRDSASKPFDRPGGHRLFRLPLGFGLLAFLAIAGFFLWTEHRAHLLGALPWLLLLACPLLHFFMHRGHGDNHGEGGQGPGSEHGGPTGHGGAR